MVRRSTSRAGCYHCEGAEFGPGGGRRVTRTDLSTGEYVMLTDRLRRRPYNSPNDICVDGHGRIYFTDPRYGDRSEMEMTIEGVYRIDLDGRVKRDHSAARHRPAQRHRGDTRLADDVHGR